MTNQFSKESVRERFNETFNFPSGDVYFADAKESLVNHLNSELSLFKQAMREDVKSLIVNTPSEVVRLNQESGVGTPLSEHAYHNALGYEEAINKVLSSELLAE